MFVQLKNLYLLYFIEKKKKETCLYSITTNNLHNSVFPSFNIFTFTEEYGTSDLFNMFTKSIKFYYTFHYHILRVQMFEKCDSSNRQ